MLQQFAQDMRYNDPARTIFGFLVGLAFMLVAVQVFFVSSYDFSNMQHGVQALFQGINPWAADTRLPDFYNPPFAMLFLSPLLILSSRMILVIGGALLMAVAFYLQSWVALAWFFTNSLLWLIAASGVDMYVMGAGLLLLLIGDRLYDKPVGLILRVLGYGFLLVKPQGGLFIVVLYLLTRRDWKGLLLSSIFYGMLFWWLYPDWIRVILTNPPLAQTIAAQSIWGKYGAAPALILGLLIVSARPWHYWQLGGALAGILSPYGMPGVPIFLTLTAVRSWIAIPIFIIYSGCLAVVTHVEPNFPIPDIYQFINPLMSIYHLSMLGLALTLACMSPRVPIEQGMITISEWLRSHLIKLTSFTKAE